MATNPWAMARVGESIEDVPDYAPPQHGAYAAPSLEAGDAYNDEFGWSPTLAQRGSTVETPSSQRLGITPSYSPRPNAIRPPEEHWRVIDADEARRHSIEDQDADGWTEKKGIQPTDRRWQDDPRRTPPPEPRLTSLLAPRTYSFVRLFDQFNRTHGSDPLIGSRRRFNGMHFSMADHRRNYEIGGMQPARSGRNTYRLEPPPWDADVVDLPPREPDMPQSRLRSVELPYGTRSWRL